uniref:EGF-like domain-containing protein n=1 Tax=Globodera pallida TaxID=36090 RepID=A0A183BNL5_GLOPA
MTSGAGRKSIGAEGWSSGRRVPDGRLFSLGIFSVIVVKWRHLWEQKGDVSRFPGCCANFGSFDCGDGVCLSVLHFHDGIADCSDGSDEHCFPEQISCGTFCADLLHLGECLRNPNCTESTETNHLQASVPSPLCPFRKRRLCGLANTVSCRGYGQCILEKWLKDGKRDCLDGSDEDEQYANLFQFVGRRTPSPASSNFVSTSATLSPPFPLPSPTPRPFLTSSATTPAIWWPILEAEGSKGASPTAISNGEGEAKEKFVPLHRDEKEGRGGVEDVQRANEESQRWTLPFPFQRPGGAEDVQRANEESQRWTLPFPFQRPGKATEWTTKAQLWEPEEKVGSDGAETAKATGTQSDGGQRAKGAATGGTAALEAAEKSSQRPPPTQRTWTTNAKSDKCRISAGFCSFATVSTFRAKIVSLCGHNFAASFSSSAPSLQEQLIVLKMLDSLPDHSFCVRKIVNDGQIVVNTVCPVECSIEMLEASTKSRGSLPEVNLKVSELTDGACYQFDLNDCDEKAQCLSDKLLFRCRCLPGTKDTSPEGEGEGRQCEGTVILQTCSKLLGVCVIVWLLMLLLLCFLLPLLSLFCLKYCFKIDPTLLRVRLRHIWRNLMDKLKGGEPTKLPTITTSQIADEMRRESLKVLPGTAARDEAVTLKVPSVSNGFGQQATIHSAHRLVPSDSEEYLIVEEGDTGGRELLKREEQQKEREEGVEEEARLSDKQTVRRQQTELSTVPSSSETGVIMLPTAREGSVQSADGTTTKSEEVVEQTTEVEVHEQVERVEEEKKGAEREAEELERPKSAASRIGTPTIWDQYKILGDQFTKYGSLEIERRKGSVTESLEELLRKREKSVEERVDEKGQDGATKGEEELDAKMELSGKRGEAEEREEQVMEEHEEGTKQEGEPEEEHRETGKVILSETLREGTLNIGFVMPPLPDGIGISRRPFFDDAGRLPSPTQHFPFKRRPFGTNGGRLYGKAISQPILSKSPAVIKEGAADFVVVKGRVGKEEDERLRKLRLLEERRQRGAGGKEEAAQKRACRVMPPGAHRGSVRDERSAAKVRKMMMSQPMFDPDLPSTSQAAVYWEKSLRRCFSPAGLQLEEYAKQRSHHLRKEGQTLHSIECQLEERVHSGCITSRKPWNVSPQPDPDLPASPLFREMTELSDGSMAQSLERLEQRVHSGCITGRKQWDSSPHKDRGALRKAPSHLDLGEPEHVDGMALGGAEDMDSPKRSRKGRTVRIREDVANDGGGRRRLGRGTENGTDAGTWLEYD